MKISKNLILTIACLSVVSSAAFADGSAFTPLNFDDSTTPTSATTSPKVESSTSKATSNPIANAWNKIVPQKDAQPVSNAPNTDAIGNGNIQNAILELDNAQVGIKNDLLNYKAKYSDIDAQFKLIKNERTMLHRQIVSIERRIRSIDRQKDQLRKNMI